MGIEDDDKSEKPPVVSEPDDPQQVKQGPEPEPCPLVAVYLLQTHPTKCPLLFYRIYDRFESLRIVHGEVGENLTVETDVLFCHFAHELGVSHTVLARCGVYPLDPECTEIALFGLAVAVCVCKTFFISVLRYCPDILSGKEVTAGSFENLFAASPRGHRIYRSWHNFDCFMEAVPVISGTFLLHSKFDMN